MKILILADLDYYEKLAKISNNRSKFLQFLKKRFENTITLIGKTNSIYQKGMKIQVLLDRISQINKANYLPDLIIHTIIGPGAGPLDSQIIVSELADISICKCLWIEDFHYVDLFTTLLKKYKFDIVLLQLRNKIVVQKYLQNYPKLIVGPLDHYIDGNVFKDYNEEKKYDVLLYGYLDDCYPFRVRLAKLLNNSSSSANRIKIIEHPGYRNLEDKDTVIGEDLATIINQSWLTVCTKSSFDLFLKKYLEAGFCRSMILGDIPSDYSDLLENKIVKITMEMSDLEILSKIDQALSNKDELLAKTDELMKELRSKYTYSAGGNYFINICNKIMSMKKYK